MRAIVGRALRTETPVFVAMLESVVFRPYWNVPRSILLKEILPAAERDRDLAQRTDYEVVTASGDPPEVVPIGPGTIDGLRRGTLRLRQRPGPANALGLVKFVFPNDADVYLHGTPAVELFAHARRDFSHGCIRVEDPAALAEWVLRDEAGWDGHRIASAMAGPASSSVQLSRPIRVVLHYTTAAVLPEDGSLHFADDIYRHDAALEQALARRPRP
jgi:murein L,D-transpeptidase YcbB/YkuD